MKDLSTTEIKPDEREALAWATSVEDGIGWQATKYPFEWQWIVNLAYLEGHQDFDWDPFSNRPIARGAKQRNKYVANKIAVAFETAVAQLTDSHPKFSALGNTASHEDRIASRVATKYLDAFWKARDMRNKLEQLVRWAAATGTGVLYNTTVQDPTTRQRIYIDPRSGAEIPAYALNDHAKRFLETQGLFFDYHSVEPDIEVESPFSIAFDGNAKDIKTARRMIHRKIVSVEEVYERFGVIVPNQEPPSYMAEFEQRLLSFYGAASIGPVSVGKQSQTGFNTTLIQEVISKPFAERTSDGKWKEWPNGRYCVTAGGRVIHDGENPYYAAGYKHGFPVSLFTFIPSLGRIWGKGLIQDLIGPQIAYNEVRRASIEGFKLHGNGKWLVPYGAGMKRGSIDATPGEVLLYKPVHGTPQHVQPNSFDGNAARELTVLARADLEDSAAQHDVLNSRVPGQIRSGPGMELAREGDLNRYGNISGRLADCVASACHNAIRLAAEVTEDSAIIESIGVLTPNELGHFRAAFLRGIKSVTVIPGSMAPRSKAMVLERVMNMIEIGALQPANSVADRAVLLNASEFNELDPEVLHLNQQRETALRENATLTAPIESGGFQPVQANSFDDDIIHLQEHYSEMMRPEYQYLPNFQKEAFRAHTFQHEQRIQQAQQAQMQQLLIAKGAPGPKGTPSPPKRG